MMKRYKIYSFIVSSLFLIGCANEKPFNDPGIKETGELSKFALDLDVRIDEAFNQIISTKADFNTINVDEFLIYFQDASTGKTVKTYSYGNMPDVVSLDEGTYKILAVYGENRASGWDNIYLKNKPEETTEFTIVRNKITSNIEPIKCYLENVMVSVRFDGNLSQRMSDDTYVEVYVNKESALKYTKEHGAYDSPVPGYFAHQDASTLTATFKGTLDGAYVEQTKTVSNVKKGNHYRITFSRYDYNGEDSSDASAGIGVDATVTTTNVEYNHVVEEDQPMDDSERKELEDKINGGSDEPGTDEPWDNNGPSITVIANPETGKEDFVLDQPSVVTADSYVALNIVSDAEDGIQEFEVDINMEGIDLESVDLANHLDLVNPDQFYLKKVQDLGLMRTSDGKDLSTLKNVKEHTFNVAELMPLLNIQPGTHTFKITVKDANGTTVKTMILVVEE